MRILSVLLLTLMLAPAAQAQGFFRALTNALSGGNKEPTVNSNSATATIGVRGMDEGGTAAAPASNEDLKLLDGWAATRVEAEIAAGKRGLAKKDVSYAQPASSGDTP